MCNGRWLTLIFIPIVFIITGCNNVQATATDPSLLEQVAEKSKIRGQFTRSFEIHELESNGKLYYVSDPKQLLIAYAKTINQQGYYKLFDVCVVGSISTNGKFGPLGRYQQQIAVRELC